MATRRKSTIEGNIMESEPSIDSIIDGNETTSDSGSTSTGPDRTIEAVIDYANDPTYKFVGYAGNEKNYRKID